MIGQRERGLLIVLVLGLIVCQVANPQFLSVSNVRDLLVQLAPFAVLSAGMTFVVLLGEIDVSIGSVAGLLSASFGLLVSRTHLGLPPPLAMALVVAAGSVCGLLTGLLVTKGRVPSIIVTLAGLALYRGAALMLLDGKWVTDVPPEARFWGTGNVAGVPVPIWAAGVSTVLAAAVAVHTKFGRQVTATGDNPRAAVARGLRVDRLRLSAFVIMGAAVGVATLMGASQLSVIESGFGTGWELFVITCVVVGGVSVTGGRGSVLGAVLAVALLGTVRTALIFLKLGDESVYWERSIHGVMILSAILLDQVGRWKHKEAAA